MLKMTNRAGVKVNSPTVIGLQPETRGSFSPLALSPAQWLDADNPLTRYQDSALTTLATADNDPVGGGVDGSGNGRNVLQATGSKRATLKLAVQNGRAGWLFDGVDDVLVSSVFNTPATDTFYMVAKLVNAAPGGNMHIANSLAPADKRVAYQAAGGTTVFMYGGAAQFGDGAWGVSAVIWRAVFNGASSTARVNATADTTNNGGSSTGNWVSIGAYQNSSNFANFYLFEYLHFGSILSAGEDTQVMAYLNTKWAVY